MTLFLKILEWELTESDRSIQKNNATTKTWGTH
jgi:hypothetical protein